MGEIVSKAAFSPPEPTYDSSLSGLTVIEGRNSRRVPLVYHTVPGYDLFPFDPWIFLNRSTAAQRSTHDPLFARQRDGHRTDPRQLPRPRSPGFARGKRRSVLTRTDR